MFCKEKEYFKFINLDNYIIEGITFKSLIIQYIIRISN